MAFFEDNLLTTTCGLTHHGAAIAVDEEMTAAIENTIVLLWLQAIHPGLPRLVRQRYGPELRSKALASLNPEIFMAISSLLDELRTQEEAKVMRDAALSFFN